MVSENDLNYVCAFDKAKLPGTPWGPTSLVLSNALAKITLHSVGEVGGGKTHISSTPIFCCMHAWGLRDKHIVFLLKAFLANVMLDF